MNIKFTQDMKNLLDDELYKNLLDNKDKIKKEIYVGNITNDYVRIKDFVIKKNNCNLEIEGKIIANKPFKIAKFKINFEEVYRIKYTQKKVEWKE